MDLTDLEDFLIYWSAEKMLSTTIAAKLCAELLRSLEVYKHGMRGQSAHFLKTYLLQFFLNFHFFVLLKTIC